MATNPTYKLTTNTKDKSGEKTGLNAYVSDAVDVSAGVPVIVTDFLTAFVTYTEMVAANITTVNSNAARKVNAGLRYGVGHREIKWRLHFTDSVLGYPYFVDVPLATNLDAISSGTDFLDNALWAGTPIETSAEALFKSKDGNVGILTAIELVRGAK